MRSRPDKRAVATGPRGRASAVKPVRARGGTERLLRERVKELECFYAIAQIAADTTAGVRESLQHVAGRLPEAWQFPEAATACIELDGMEPIGATGALAPERRQDAPIVINGNPCGRVTVGYPDAFVPPADQALLLPEEQRLLAEVARRIAGLVERIAAREAQAQLQEQVRHADRLATIGQLASGVAHELNEPLGSILGFAQLVSGTPRLPKGARADLARIEAAALHARDIIRELMLFARQSQPSLASLDLNRLIEESSTLWAWRCEDRDIKTRYRLDPGLPRLHADAAQMRQVLANLIVNAIQAMPEGGRLTVETEAAGETVGLRVSDTGEGIQPSLLPRIFDPFFTTKDVNQGTGLGLAVVHGIITAHGGRIDVESTPGRGTCVCARLPIRGPAAGAPEPEGV